MSDERAREEARWKAISDCEAWLRWQADQWRDGAHSPVADATDWLATNLRKGLIEMEVRAEVERRALDG